MEILLRERRGVGAAVEYHDREVTARVVTIGSAPNQTIQLLGEVAPQHATISGNSGAARLDCTGKNRVRVNGKAVRSARLAAGDRVELAGHQLEIIEAPAGFDLGLQVTVDAKVRTSAFEGAFQTHLSQTLLGNRSVAWLLLAMVILGGLVVPAYLSHTESTPSVTAWPLDDRIWSTGALLPAHELTIGTECSACHTDFFQRVRDEQCATCHTDVRDHVADFVAAGVQPDRCATCHKEHNDPQYLIVRRGALCTDCHSQPIAVPPQTSLDAVTGFAESTHPPFDVHLLAYREGGAANGLPFVWDDRIESPENAIEQSNLKFPHDLHLDPQKVLRPRDSVALGCGDCHVLSSDREHFAPVQMETHCRDCHDLRFDEENRERELPHGTPSEVVYTLKGYFYSKFNDPAARPAAQRRRTLRPRRDDDCASAPNDCAVAATAAEIVSQFNTRGCVTCHVVEDNGNANVEQRFDVRPVRLQSDYFPASHFPHDKHLTQGGAVGDEACATCHTSPTSNDAADVLIPGIATCADCHGDSTVPGKVVLECISCHSYHPHAPAVRTTAVE
jgi:predicted CXXCH cytochrome family protein